MTNIQMGMLLVRRLHASISDKLWIICEITLSCQTMWLQYVAVRQETETPLFAFFENEKVLVRKQVNILIESEARLLHLSFETLL